MNKSPTTDKLLSLSFSSWMTISLMMFGVVDAQNNKGRRILTVLEMLRLNEFGGVLKDQLFHLPSFSWSMAAVPLTSPQMEVLLKVICWYEDSLFGLSPSAIKQVGEYEITARYEKLTKIRRALQTAPPSGSDQLDR